MEWVGTESFDAAVAWKVYQHQVQIPGTTKVGILGGIIYLL
jgi:hypothetical protein